MNWIDSQRQPRHLLHQNVDKHFRCLLKNFRQFVYQVRSKDVFAKGQLFFLFFLNPKVLLCADQLEQHYHYLKTYTQSYA